MLCGAYSIIQILLGGEWNLWTGLACGRIDAMAGFRRSGQLSIDDVVEGLASISKATPEKDGNGLVATMEAPTVKSSFSACWGAASAEECIASSDVAGV